MYDMQNSEYFNSLTENMQQRIMSSHLEFYDDEDIRRFVTNINQDHFEI